MQPMFPPAGSTPLPSYVQRQPQRPQNLFDTYRRCCLLRWGVPGAGNSSPNEASRLSGGAGGCGVGGDGGGGVFGRPKSGCRGDPHHFVEGSGEIDGDGVLVSNGDSAVTGELGSGVDVVLDEISATTGEIGGDVVFGFDVESVVTGEVDVFIFVADSGVTGEVGGDLGSKLGDDVSGDAALEFAVVDAPDARPDGNTGALDEGGRGMGETGLEI